MKQLQFLYVCVKFINCKNEKKKINNSLVKSEFKKKTTTTQKQIIKLCKKTQTQAHIDKE